ncbi:hypothetical protein HK099_004800 [Clydaea vesicula]|uniref:Uncharacterized protein n=1 Tax=Clydaea vesicula TaxID=447962 RepID=A0AAD5U9P4_9FUNG|nr:hypothetical protein HK099_004800 [Clydaea vesicula]
MGILGFDGQEITPQPWSHLNNDDDKQYQQLMAEKKNKLQLDELRLQTAKQSSKTIISAKRNTPTKKKDQQPSIPVVKNNKFTGSTDDITETEIIVETFPGSPYLRKEKVRTAPYSKLLVQHHDTETRENSYISTSREALFRLSANSKLVAKGLSGKDLNTMTWFHKNLNAGSFANLENNDQAIKDLKVSKSNKPNNAMMYKPTVLQQGEANEIYDRMKSLDGFRFAELLNSPKVYTTYNMKLPKTAGDAPSYRQSVGPIANNERKSTVFNKFLTKKNFEDFKNGNEMKNKENAFDIDHLTNGKKNRKFKSESDLFNFKKHNFSYYLPNENDSKSKKNVNDEGKPSTASQVEEEGRARANSNRRFTKKMFLDERPKSLFKSSKEKVLKNSENEQGFKEEGKKKVIEGEEKENNEKFINSNVNTAGARQIERRNKWKTSNSVSAKQNSPTTPHKLKLHDLNKFETNKNDITVILPVYLPSLPSHLKNFKENEANKSNYYVKAEKWHLDSVKVLNKKELLKKIIIFNQSHELKNEKNFEIFFKSLDDENNESKKIKINTKNSENLKLPDVSGWTPKFKKDEIKMIENKYKKPVVVEENSNPHKSKREKFDEEKYFRPGKIIRFSLPRGKFFNHSKNSIRMQFNKQMTRLVNEEEDERIKDIKAEYTTSYKSQKI